MNKGATELHKNQLLKLESELHNQLSQLQQSPDFGNDPEGNNYDEETDEAEEISNNVSLIDNIKERLTNVQAALLRIKNNTYGKCVACGAVIDEKVLNAMPESSLCRNCKEKAAA